LGKLKEDFEVQLEGKRSLAEATDATRVRVSRAEELLQGLAKETACWTGESKSYDQRRLHLAGNVAQVCTFLAYAGPFNEEVRLKLRGQLGADLASQGVPCSPASMASFDDLLVSFLSDAGTVQEWGTLGLPSDARSIQNGKFVALLTTLCMIIFTVCY